MSDPDLTTPRNPYLPTPPAQPGAPGGSGQGGPAPTQPLHPFPAAPTQGPPYGGAPSPSPLPTTPMPWGQPSLPQQVPPAHAAAPGAGGPHPYGPHGVPWGPPPDHPQSTTALVLGVVAIMGFLPTGPFAWVIGARARKAIDADPARYGGRGLATTGYVLGIVTSIMLMAFVGLVALLVAVGIAGA